MATKTLKGISQTKDFSTYWKHRILDLVGTEFEIDNGTCFSKVDNQFYPSNWLVFDTDLEAMINQRQDLSGQIEALDIDRYFEEVKNDVLNLDDRYKARLGEWLCEHLDIDVVKDNEWNNDN
jgi:hypothetical protein